MVTKRKQPTTVETDTAEKRNSLRLRLDDLITISPKTAKQKEFFDAYKAGDYFMCLHGVAGTGRATLLYTKPLKR